MRMSPFSFVRRVLAVRVTGTGEEASASLS